MNPSLPAESVWDYPRPPRVERVEATLSVIHRGQTVACTQDGVRVLETSHPPTYYFPPEAVREDWLRPIALQTWCEFKGRARYFDLEIPDTPPVARVCWCYPTPRGRFAGLAGYYAFYGTALDACWVGDQPVDAQRGRFYGGWITPNLIGPFKGEPGTEGW